MAISAGTKTTNVTNPGGTTITFNHNQNTGDDRFLVIAVAHNKSNQISNIKYNNVQLTSRVYYNGAHHKYGYFVLANPATGTNQVKITFTAGAWNPCGTQVFSFTGASSAGGVVGNNDVANTPHSRNRTGVTADSLMLLMGTGTSTPQQSGWRINNVALTKRHVLNVGGRMGVGLSTNALPAGTIATKVTASASWKKFTNVTLEIKAAVTATPTLTTSPSAVSGMTYTLGNGPSAESSTTFTVNGSNLTANVVFTIPSSFEATLTSGSSYSNSLTLPQSPSGTITNLTVFVRAKNGLSQGTTNEQGTVASTGATTQNRQFTVSVTADTGRRRIIIC